MRTLDTLEPGERFKTLSFGREGIVVGQHEGSVYVRWDRVGFFGTNVTYKRQEHISRKTEVE